ncbi:HERV-H LTR-associating protein 2 isoform X2 [Macrotis lagotis]|uniref:HERV-H LTR-associating protein 2 isoform X2 n=1 Tax=Macrotis lagotis TaxID=92651 RepID=UPI003D685073
MKRKPLLYLYLLTVLVQPLTGFDSELAFFRSYKHFSSPETTVTGRLYEDVILPCSFQPESGIVIHWLKDQRTIHSYYRDRDQLLRQDPSYANRTSLFLSEINNGNASLKLTGLNLQDEGIYKCYTSTDHQKVKELVEVELKLGAFITPVMEYQEQAKVDYLTCYLLGAYPYSHITWTENNSENLESNIEEIQHDSLFSLKSRLNITGSTSSYQCIIENPLLNQRWIGKWNIEGTLLTKEGEKTFFPCKLENEDFLQEKNITVNWYRVENANFSNLASFPMIFDNRFSWTRENFSLSLRSPTPSDSGKYLCNISSVDYTQLTVQLLTVVSYQRSSFYRAHSAIAAGICTVIICIVIGVIMHKKGINLNHRYSGAPQNEVQEPNSQNNGTEENT